MRSQRQLLRNEQLSRGVRQSEQPQYEQSPREQPVYDQLRPAGFQREQLRNEQPRHGGQQPEQAWHISSRGDYSRHEQRHGLDSYEYFDDSWSDEDLAPPSSSSPISRTDSIKIQPDFFIDEQQREVKN